jgi:tannase/feruloyl esterase
MKVRLAALYLLLAPLAARQTPNMPTMCDRLSALTLPNTRIMLARIVDAGGFRPPDESRGAGATQDAAAQPFKDLPSFCRVTATLTPSADSDIKMEVWLPASDWNGKFLGVGNGGWSGSIVYTAPTFSLADALRRGYAVASTDTGHVGSDARFSLGHPEKLVDFAYRAVHEMTLRAKSIATGYYGRGPRLSYWGGCSGGGRQALVEAQRYPADYDGIIAGAPAIDWSGGAIHGLWVAQAALKNAGSYIPPEKFAEIHQAVLDACDTIDGVRDGVLEDPRRCVFDPAVLQCKGADAATCLTASQVETARKIYGPARNPRTGVELSPGKEPGSELGWTAHARGPNPDDTVTSYFKYVVFKNPSWDYKTLDFDKDAASAERAASGSINATDPNLAPFLERGGKLIMYQGWSDQLIPPRRTIAYYDSVVAKLGGASDLTNGLRLFMVPGMTHCGTREGVSTFDRLAALEQWVEQKQAPDRIIGSHLTGGVVDRTRPVCPYPQIAKYNGTGSTDDAANFACQVP